MPRHYRGYGFNRGYGFGVPFIGGPFFGGFLGSFLGSQIRPYGPYPLPYSPYPYYNSPFYPPYGPY